MAFDPKFSAGFAGLVLDNVQAVLERDMADALAAIDSDLAPIADYDTPIEIVLNFPALYLEPDASAIQQSDDDSYVQSQHTLVVSLAIVGPDADSLKTAMVKYVRAVDQVLRTMSHDDLSGGVSSVTGPPSWEVVDHRYGILRRSDTIYRRDAQLVLVVQILER